MAVLMRFIFPTARWRQAGWIMMVVMGLTGRLWNRPWGKAEGGIPYALDHAQRV